MQVFFLICRVLLGSLFIFSGLVKLNDPYGTAYKLEEYFEVFAAEGLPVFLKLVPFSLFLSIVISAFEVILGAAILMYYRMRITLWVTLALMVFFTFLTFYSFAFDKVRECGCFGTTFKLTAKHSFYKDLGILGLVIALFFRNKTNDPVNSLVRDITMAFVTLIAFGTGIYSKNHLPFTDPTSYKVGNDLRRLTRPREAPRYQWVLEKGGKEYVFTDENYPSSDSSYKYKKHILLTDSSLIVPEIAGYRVYNDDGDFTAQSLHGKKVFVVISDPVEALENCGKECVSAINRLTGALEKQGFETMVLTAPAEGTGFEDYRMEVQLRGDYYYMDDGILKTMIRSNPGVMLLNDGVILGKWHYKHIPAPENLNVYAK